MRDTLTAIAALVILVLAAALIVPPLVDWEARRGLIEGAIARTTGVEVRTEGPLRLRLLPSPRVHIDRLRLGSDPAVEPSVDARSITAEVALAPLLKGEVRFTQVEIGRVDARVPHDGAGVKVRPEWLDDAALRRELAIEDLTVGQVQITATAPGGGQSDQVYAEALRVTAHSLAGPWVVEGRAGSAPFRLATGALGPDRTVQAKLSGGGNLHPRFDLDARLSFVPDGEGLLTPVAQGTARVFLGPPAQVAASGLPIPVLVQATFKTGPDRVDLAPLTVEAGEGGASLRLTGTGAVRLEQPAIQIKLEGRRLDLDSFILSASGRELSSRPDLWRLPSAGVPVDLDLAINSIGLAQEEFSDLVIRGGLRRGGAVLERLTITAPGQTRVALRGEAGIAESGGLRGSFTLRSDASDRLGRYLSRLGAPTRVTSPLDGRRLEASGDLTLAETASALRNFEATLGQAKLTGGARYTAPEAGRRGRLEAEVALSGASLDELPRIAEWFEASPDLDLSLALEARDLTHGGRPGAGRITARVRSDGPALAVDALEITDLAGASARLGGRISPDGSGRITGHVTAPRAAPVIDLLGSIWVGPVTRFIPAFLREGPLDLDVACERAPPGPGSPEPRLRTTAEGRAAGGQLRIETVQGDGRTQNLAVRIATENAGLWVGKPDLPVLRRSSNLELRGVRVVGGAFTVTASGDLGGVRVATTRPLVLAEADDMVEAGEVELTTPDMTPFLVLLGDGAGVAPPVPAQLRVTLSRDLDAALLAVQGRINDGAVNARFTVRSRANLTGEVGVDTLSLPWLANAFALQAGPDPNATALWSTTRFGQSGQVLPGGQVAVTARRALIGRGLVGEDARFTLALNPEGLEIREFQAGLAGTRGEGRIAGALRVTRQEAQGTLAGEGRIEAPIGALVPGSPFSGRLQVALRFGGVGETLSAVVNNLGGSGEVGIAAFSAPGLDPGGIGRALARLLADPDPLRRQRIEAVAAEELARAPFTAPALAAPATIAGGVVRLNPLTARANSGAATWRGAVALDLRTLQLDARGLLTSASAPPNWPGGLPQVGVAWRGPLASPSREIDAGPLTSGVAAMVLQRELDTIDRLEAERRRREGARPGEGAAAPGGPDALIRPAPPEPRAAPGG